MCNVCLLLIGYIFKARKIIINAVVTSHYFHLAGKSLWDYVTSKGKTVLSLRIRVLFLLEDGGYPIFLGLGGDFDVVWLTEYGGCRRRKK